jgi:chemotaxis protein MotD
MRKVGRDGPSEAAAPPRSAPVKVLTLQLEPADLGAIAIKLRLIGNHLDMQVEATQHDTLQALVNDHDRLRQLLQSGGYSIDSLSIKSTASSGADLGSHLNRPERDQSPPNEGKNASGSTPGGSDQRGGRDRRPQDARGLPIEDNHAVSPIDRSRVGHYV